MCTQSAWTNKHLQKGFKVCYLLKWPGPPINPVKYAYPEPDNTIANLNRPSRQQENAHNSHGALNLKVRCL